MSTHRDAPPGVYADVDRRVLDLRPVLARAARPARYVIHYAERHRLDRVHAVRMRRIEGVELRPYPFLDHNVVGELQARGELPDLLHAIVS
jgi:hypothetical protein